MTRVRVKGFKIFDDRHGKARCYHRKTGIKIDLAAHPIGSAGFLAECARIAAIEDAQAARAAKPGTLAALIEVYRRSDRYRDLADRTKRDYGKCADYLKPIGDTPAHRIDTPLCAGIHAKAAAKLGWRQGNMVRTFLGEVFKQCVPLGLIDRNHMADAIPKRRPKGLPRANRPWQPGEVAAVLDAAPAHLRIALTLMAFTGLDPSDAIRLTRNQITGGVIRGERGKTGEAVAVPILTELAAALAAAPAHDAITVLATSRGTPWTYDGLATVWHRFKAKLEAAGTIGPGLTMKGLRHTVATALREGGAAPRAIADYLGQRTESMALHYSRDADLEKRNAATGKALAKANVTGTEIVKPDRKKRQTSKKGEQA